MAYFVSTLLSLYHNGVLDFFRLYMGVDNSYANIDQQLRGNMNMFVEINTYVTFLMIFNYSYNEEYSFVKSKYADKEFIPSISKFQYNGNDNQRSIQCNIQIRHDFIVICHYYHRLCTKMLQFWKQKFISKSSAMFGKLRRLPTTNIWTKKRKKR